MSTTAETRPQDVPPRTGIRDSWTIAARPGVGGRHARVEDRNDSGNTWSASEAVTAPMPAGSAPMTDTTTPPAERVGTPEPVTAPGRSVAGRLGDWVLNLLALFGVVCIALTVAAVVGNYSIILFKTGSMDPTIPQGSAAIVHEIPATEVRVGDVITVDREAGQRPITHRVIGVEPVGGGEVLVSMQGDANPTPDPEPYRVSTVREVMWHLPGLASAVVWLSNPFVLGGITIGASLLVLWAFWPKRRRDDELDSADYPRL